MKVSAFALCFLSLVFALYAVPCFAQELEPWRDWRPDFSSQGVTLTEPFEGYLYDPKVVHGGTLIIPVPSDPPEQHQWNMGAAASQHFLIPMNDYLVRIDPITGGPVPWLAESWELSEDRLAYTVHLVRGVKFHDGTEMTSEDVKWCYDFVMANNFTRMSEVWGYLDRNQPTEIIDDYTLKFHLLEPFVSFARETLGEVMIQPKHVWEEIVARPDFDWMTYTPTLDEQVGCGPYKLVKYVPNSYYKFEAFEDYWHGRPYVDEFIRPIVTSGDVELLAVKRGEADVFTGFLASQAIPGLLREEGIGIHIYNNPYMFHWGFNNQKWPFSVKEFRYACAHAVDKQDLVDTLLIGYGITGPVGVEAPFYDFWYNPNVTQTYNFDLVKAAEILDDLGWVDTDGGGIREGTGEHASEPLAFDIGPPIYDPVRVRAAELIAENLAQIGIDATVQYMEWKTLWGKIIQPLDSPTKIDSWILGSGQSIDPEWMKTRLHSSAIPNPNYYGFVSAECDGLAELQSTQFDIEERRRTVWRMQEILAEEVPLIVLYFRQSPSVYRTDKLTGWVDSFDNPRGNSWDIINVREKALQTLRSMSVSVTDTPPPEVEIGEAITLGIKYTGPEGESITDASVTAMLTGDPISHTMEHVGGGTYRTSFDTAGWTEGSYTMRVSAVAIGFNDRITTFAIEASEPAATEGPTRSFWESYGAMVAGVTATLAILAIVAVHSYSKRTSY